MFQKGLNNALLLRLHSQTELPKILEEWYKRAMTLDGNYRRFVHITGKTESKSPKQKYWFKYQRKKNPNMMNTSLGATLTEEQRIEHMKKYCRQCPQTFVILYRIYENIYY